MRRYLWHYVLPAIGMLILAFWAGAQKNAALGLLGFLPFFTIAVALLIEGWKRMRQSDGKQ